MAQVLYAEDDREIAAMVQFRLAEGGHEVTLAYDGAEAQAALADGVFDVVLLDVMLPGVDGFALCRELAEREDRPGIILISGRDTSADVAAGRDAGADDYVAKPFDPSDLARRVDALTRR